MHKIGLIDVDGHNFPNLALMKIAGWHRRNGNEVSWYTPFDHYDIVYMSKVFTFSRWTGEYIDNTDDLIIGGTGFNMLKLRLPSEIEFGNPDYSIYKVPDDTAYGFLTRGCHNHCQWCVVPKKEGMIRPHMDVEEIAIDGRKKLILMDNNILAAGDYALSQLEKIIKNGYRIDFNQAIDTRLVDKCNAELLGKIKWLSYIRFGCDTQRQIYDCELAIELLRSNGYKGNFLLYTMLHGDIEENEKRLEHWRGKYNGRVKCHAQPYIDFSGTSIIPQWQKDMARWCNRHVYYAASKFRDFEIRKGFVCSQHFR